MKKIALALATVMVAFIGCGGEDNPTRTPDESGTATEGEPSDTGDVANPQPSCKTEATCSEGTPTTTPDPEVQPDPVDDPDPASNDPPDGHAEDPLKPKECDPSTKYQEGMTLICQFGSDWPVTLTRNPTNCLWQYGAAPDGIPIFVGGLRDEDVDTECSIPPN